VSVPLEDVTAGRVEFGDIVDPSERRLPPLHPGEVLREEFLGPLGMSAYALAKSLCVPLNRITAVLAGERAVSADTALRLGRYFSTTPEFWINLQGAYDLEVARLDHGDEIAAEVEPADRIAAVLDPP
jgi:addiction module HigA family antidote